MAGQGGVGGLCGRELAEGFVLDAEGGGDDGDAGDDPRNGVNG